MASNKKLYWILAILSMAGNAWIGFHLFTGKLDSSLTVCLFKNITGIPCPSCGITRAVLLLISGDFRGALHMNPLGFVTAPALFILPAWIAADLLRAKNTLANSILWTEKKINSQKSIYVPLVALALINWGWNILKEL